VSTDAKTAEADATASPDAATDAWREALASRRTAVRDTVSVPSAQAERPDYEEISRRRFIAGSFWTGLGVTLLGSVGLMTDFIYPRNVKGFGGPVPAGHVSEFRRGDQPRPNPIGQFWLANLDPAETRPGGSGGANGLLALWRKCPHLGCTVPWRETFNYEGDRGWYRCPCHGSTYTRSGIRVFGPAPRSMDSMAIEIDDDGNITVQTGQRTNGGPDNPERAVTHPLLPT
jgi:cytochrome b6-f complex iron-sulfur subunit